MIRVTISIVPSGDYSRYQILDVITISNISALSPISDYVVDSMKMDTAFVRRFRRNERDAADLVVRAIRSLKRQEARRKKKQAGGSNGERTSHNNEAVQVRGVQQHLSGGEEARPTA